MGSHRNPTINLLQVGISNNKVVAPMLDPIVALYAVSLLRLRTNLLFDFTMSLYKLYEFGSKSYNKQDLLIAS